jgi:hypothetical protein
MNSLTTGSYFSTKIVNNQIFIKIKMNINLIYTSNDYNLVFYDSISFLKCYTGSTSSRNTTWDTTLGWILGFQQYSEYILSEYPNNNNNILVVGDTGVLTNPVNSVFLCLDEYSQNHLNDGLVTISSKNKNIPLPSYASRTNFICDPISEELVYNDYNDSINEFSKLTRKQVYSITQIANSNNNSSNLTKGINSKYFGLGPNIQDIFAIVPLKVSGTAPGSIFTEFGGTLQNQERVYFGPVNISRMSIKLVTDRGNTLDLNNSNWSFALLCEQLYKQQVSKK